MEGAGRVEVRHSPWLGGGDGDLMRSPDSSATDKQSVVGTYINDQHYDLTKYYDNFNVLFRIVAL